MNNKQKNYLRQEILALISHSKGKKTTSDLTEVLGYILMDIGFSSMVTSKAITEKDQYTIKDIHKVLDMNNNKPTLSGALVLQGALMLGWINDANLVTK